MEMISQGWPLYATNGAVVFAVVGWRLDRAREPMVPVLTAINRQNNEPATADSTARLGLTLTPDLREAQYLAGQSRG